ncbi:MULTISPECIES: DUF6895 family protein [unclassified Streptomyces]|uniref:DUF6895 family protein n=1 Tax=unclassified Streptomyces TaxID=2593676 RepID=UPI00093EC3F9|nr:hypothetical protein [Streptomyces sp. TSRI0281]OKI34868.1 hypothetical protein A6A29_15610 [Streptomyces sp. TSRI0281]
MTASAPADLGAQPGGTTGAALSVLPRVLRRALGWADAHRSGFVLPQDVLEPHTKVNDTLKPLGELAQLCTTIRRSTAPDTPEHGTSGELIAFAWEQVHDGDLLLELLRGEPFAAYPYEIYAAFAGYGLRHEGFERLAGTLSSTRGWAHTEQHANRELGLINSERRVGAAPHTDPGPVLARTWLGGLSEPWMFEGPSGYALTHTVFHITDWCCVPERMPADIDAYLRAWLPPWVDGCLESMQWDLTGELLAVAAALPGPPPSALLDAAWPALAAAQAPGGAVPETGPPVSPEDAPPGGAGPGPDPYPFLACYHSTLVTAFAAALCLKRLTAHRPDAATAEAGAAA